MSNATQEPVESPHPHESASESAGPDETVDRLLEISDRLAEASQELLALGAGRYRTDGVQTAFLMAMKRSRDDDETDLIDHAKRVYDERRKRDAIFNEPDLFGEPAWDILLDLMHAEHRGKRVSVTSSCIGSAVPPTTALRWLKILESKGLIERVFDERDARRQFVRLTPAGLTKMRTYFRATQGNGACR